MIKNCLIIVFSFIQRILSLELFLKIKKNKGEIRIMGMRNISIGAYTGFDDGLFLMAWE